MGKPKQIIIDTDNRRNHAEIVVGIDIPTDDVNVIIDHKWVTIRGRPINVGGGAGGGGVAGRQIPDLKHATGAEKTKLLAISGYMIAVNQNKPSQEQSIAKNKAIKAGMSINEYKSITTTKGKDCKLDSGNSIFEKTAKKVLEPKEISKAEAVGTIRDSFKGKENVLDGWFRNADSSYKQQITDEIQKNPKLHNAALNVFHKEYQAGTGSKVSFNNFMNSNLTLYRGGKKPKNESFVSFTYNKKMAQGFATKNKSPLHTISVKPRNTFGMLQTIAEGEVLVPGSLKFSEEIEVGIDIPTDDVNVIIDHAWKTLPSGKQVMIRSGDPGALNGNDMRKIDIAVKEAIADPVMMYNIRQDLVREYIPEKWKGSKQQKHLEMGAQDWENSPSGSAATNMVISSNVIKGRKRHAGLSPNQLKEAKLFEQNNDKFPQPEMLKAVNVQAVFNKGMAKEKFGAEPFTVYRGISGDQAKAIQAKAKTGDTIRIDSNSLSSFTTNPEIAKQFIRNIKTKKTDGIIIKTKVSYKNVFDSYASSEALNGRYHEREVIVSPRGMKITGVIM